MITKKARIRALFFVSTLAALAVSGVSAAQEMPATDDLGRIAGLVRWSGVLISVFVLIGATLALRFLTGAVGELATRFTHRRLLFQQIESFTRFFVYFATGGIVIALSLQLNETVLTLVGGTLAVAIGFAMRDLVAAMIAGVTIMLDRPFQVGDRVQYAGEYGDITAIGLRSVRMQTLDDNTVTIPNNKVLTDVTSSGNYGALDMQIQIDFWIGLDQDIDLAVRLVNEGLLTSSYVYLDKPVVVLVKQVIQGDLIAIYLRAKAYVLDTHYEKAFETDVSRRVLRAFREHNILPPAVLHRQLPAVTDPAAAPRSGPKPSDERAKN